jgi:hypothetical protein
MYDRMNEKMRKNWFFSVPISLFEFFCKQKLLSHDSVNVKLSGEDWEEKLDNFHFLYLNEMPQPSKK